MSEATLKPDILDVKGRAAVDANAKAMPPKSNDDKTGFWNLANIRLSILNGLIVAVVAVAAAWTSNAVTQTAFAGRLDKVESIVQVKAENRDKEFRVVSDRLDRMVTQETLELQLKPLTKQLDNQAMILDQIRVAVISRSATDPASP